METRTAELEDAIREKDRRIQELKADLDKANDLAQRQREAVQDCSDLLDSWQEAFEMVPTDDGMLTWAPWVAQHEAYRTAYKDLASKWNRFVPEYNAAIGPRRNRGRPLNASDAQCVTVLKLHGAGRSLRGIAEETSLSLQTVRTIIDRHDFRDRNTLKHIQRIKPDASADRTWQRQGRTRRALPRQITILRSVLEDLRKEAKGLR